MKADDEHFTFLVILTVLYRDDIFSYFPSDPPYVTEDLREAGSFKNAMDTLKSEMDNLQKDLRNSVPFFSSRYKVTL